MPILQHAKTEHYEWGIWQITESEEQLLAHIDHLYPAYNIQLAHFTAIHRRLEWLATRALLSALIPQAPEIIYNDNGRPHLSDNSYHISIGISCIVIGFCNFWIPIDITSQTYILGQFV